MKAFYIAISAFVVSNMMNAQQITLSPSSLQFDTVLVGARDSLAFRIHNTGADTLRVTDINASKAAFTVSDTTCIVLPGDSVSIRVFFQTNQNLTWKDVLLIENSGGGGTLVLPLRGTAKYPGTAYATTQGLWENDLKNALLNLVTNHTVLGYNTARDRMYETIDDPLNNDTLECIYTGRKIFARNRTEAQALNFNAEHSWPQSNFGSADPMVSDLHHLFPTDETANSQRSNYPFGPVVSNITWQVGGSKLGRNPNGLVAFEPRDVHKGDVARALFYFLIRYPNNYGNFMDAIQEFYLRQWYRSDPVSQKETLRNNAIALYQGKRNPLVDHPEFIDRITYFRSSVAPPLQPDILASPGSIRFNPVVAGDSTDFRLIIVNRGRTQLMVSSVSLQFPSQVFGILDAPLSVPVDSFWTLRIRFKPDAANQTYSNSVLIQSDDPDSPVLSVSISGSSTGISSVSYASLPGDYALYQNYPNPFNPATTISFALGRSSWVSLKVFDLLGREMSTLVNERMQTGTYNVVWNSAGATSGVYVYRLYADGVVQSKRMLLIK